MKKLLALIAAALMMAPTVCHADEGMWIPMLLGRNQAAMQKAGMPRASLSATKAWCSPTTTAATAT